MCCSSCCWMNSNGKLDAFAEAHGTTMHVDGIKSILDHLFKVFRKGLNENRLPTESKLIEQEASKQGEIRRLVQVCGVIVRSCAVLFAFSSYLKEPRVAQSLSVKASNLQDGATTAGWIGKELFKDDFIFKVLRHFLNIRLYLTRMFLLHQDRPWIEQSSQM